MPPVVQDRSQKENVDFRPNIIIHDEYIQQKSYTSILIAFRLINVTKM